MMKIELLFKTEDEKDAFLPFNYNYQLSSAIYSKIEDSKYSEKLHTSESFKFFNFSQIFINKLKIKENRLIAKKGRIKIYISSPDDYFIKNIISGFINNPYLRINNQIFIVSHIREVELHELSNVEKVKTISPIISRTKKLVNNELKIWDLAPGDHFFKNLEQNLIKKYETFNNKIFFNKTIKIYSEMRNVKQKRVIIKKDENRVYHRCYFMDLILEGDIDLIKFAYETGIGEKNSMGFGMIEKNDKG